MGFTGFDVGVLGVGGGEAVVAAGVGAMAAGEPGVFSPSTRSV